ncbi:gp16 family protein [Serpentinimonas maccroryi]|uniref:gp16 family protein n=1 Tax=Serpentinimonas maccroryi TaxID=1458426 RepID=UPI002033B387|nr:regulatory protein GemA [Serpentinimonas maccroryi]MCM2480195.1 regulatory protein GemA [Serpentinimonas maccroryi]
MSRPDTTEAQRLKLIRLIHVARRELGQDEPTYRTMLLTAGKAASTTQMGVPALRAVVEHAKRCGFKVRAAAARAPDRRQDGSAQARKVRALWLFLHHLGVVRDPSERALAAYVKRQAKVDDLHWAHERYLVQLIEALKQWALRELRTVLVALQNELALQPQPPGPEQAQALLRARQILQAGAQYDGHLQAWVLLQQALGRPLPPGLDALLAPAGAQGVRA